MENNCMQFTNTRNKNERISGAAAILRGLADDGGLFVPAEEIPELDPAEILSDPYPVLAGKILSKFLTDYSEEEIEACITPAYGTGRMEASGNAGTESASGRFDTPAIVPMTKYTGGYFMELWHGPTCAFKDLALTVLPHLLSAAYRKEGYDGTVAILTATSGDTGKAALEGFADVPHTNITVFYPEEGVSAVQKRQMTTSRGSNVNVAAVKGNFDDCQRLVKAAYGNEDVRRAAGKSVRLSSANSINLGRLLPQIVYYYAAYAALVRRGAIACGDKILFSVPTGNFGDILAGYLAKRMGLPVSRLLCASNENRVLTDFLETGIYDARRPLRLTMSPSMDILVSSNLERLLFDASGSDDAFVRSAMADLKTKGVFTADAAVMEKIRAVFAGYETDEAECAAFLRTLWEKEGLLVDPHTAVATASLGKYRAETGDTTPAVVLSTASPFKFCRDVLSSIFPEETGLADEFAMMDRLAERTGIRPPAPLAELRGRQVRFTDSISPEEGMTYLGGLLRRLAQE